MATIIVHLSDFHNVKGKSENHAVLVNALFTDLESQLKDSVTDNVYLAFSGDIVQAADAQEQYEDFQSAFDGRLDRLGIPKARRIVVPGNHDVSRAYVEKNFVEHEGVVRQNLPEQSFNDYVAKPGNVLLGKFKNYIDFQTEFSDIGLAHDRLTGAGWELPGNIGVYCLNTAICSSGGLDRNGEPVGDKRRLGIDTRSLHLWVMNSSAKWKILLMHHPLTWLTESSERELRIILKKSFALCLSGHEHDQASQQSFSFGNSLIECSAPALFTTKSDELGYMLATIEPKLGIRGLNYRQWTKHQTFVAGSGLSNTDNGKVTFHAALSDLTHATNLEGISFIERYLDQRLQTALVSFSGQPSCWIDPILKLVPEAIKDEDSKASFDLTSLLVRPTSRSIKAPPQFGLTCLSLFLVREAWTTQGKFWLYLDIKELKPHKQSITEAVAKELSLVGLAHSEIVCVVIDSIDATNEKLPKFLEKVTEAFPSTPILCMETVAPGAMFTKGTTESETYSDNSPLYLWTLTRGHIRKLIVSYNNLHPIGEEDLVTSKIVADLDVLNLHRTPFNCLTLLKVLEVDFDESPVNRSEMIKRVLFLLFNVDVVPTYKARPDLKDCEYVLGYFCETLLKENTYTFTRAHFLNVMVECCREQLIDLEVQVVFDVLSANNILVMRDGHFSFRFSFWIYYFAALRMHHDSKFANFIFSDMRYANYPEIVEFYTGIDRRREDALEILISDLAQMRERVEEKCGLPKELNPYRLAQWTPSPEAVNSMKIELNNGIQESNLSADIKDVFADRTYNPSRAYDQNINILSDSSFVYLRETLRAASKALRNSDYASPSVKRRLLEEIVKAWEQMSMVLLVVMPVLADKGHADFDGSWFLLDGDFGATLEERVTRIAIEIPANIVAWSRDDLLSSKMGPLLIDVFKHQKSELGKHELLLLLITQRPRGWHEQVKTYISSVAKNSFYLLDVYRCLRAQYRYSYASVQTLKDITHLIMMAVTKHVTGHKDPGVKLIEKTMPMVVGEPVIPHREV